MTSSIDYALMASNAYAVKEPWPKGSAWPKGSVSEYFLNCANNQ